VHFAEIADSTTLEQAESELLHQSPNPASEEAMHRSR
jgi:hypothetical protein